MNAPIRDGHRVKIRKYEAQFRLRKNRIILQFEFTRMPNVVGIQRRYPLALRDRQSGVSCCGWPAVTCAKDAHTEPLG
jgi:hypothetical protein